MSFHLHRKPRHRRSLTAARLSQLTWTAADRRAWMDAYAAAVRCSGIREASAALDTHSRHVDYLSGEGA